MSPRTASIQHLLAVVALSSSLLTGAPAALADSNGVSVSPTIPQEDRSRPGQASVPSVPKALLGPATDGLPGEHRLHLKPADWITLYYLDEHYGITPVDICGTGFLPPDQVEPVIVAGFDYDGCDGSTDWMWRGLLRFDLSRVSSLPRKILTHAELRYDEEVVVQVFENGGSQFNCATRLDPAVQDWTWMQYGRHGHNSKWDSAGILIPVFDDSREISLEGGGRYNVTPIVLGWLSGRYPNYGWVFRGGNESLSGDERCEGRISHMELIVDYIVPD